jgi:hypothetical protein
MTSNKTWNHILTTAYEKTNIKEIGQWLTNDWQLNIKNIVEHTNGYTFKVEDLVTVTTHSAPRTIDQASYSMAIINNYTWQNIYNEKDLYTHDIKVTFEFHEGTKLEQFTLLSKIVASMLKSLDHSIAVYVESAIMVVDRMMYIERLNLLKDDLLPVDLWIYIGIGKDEYSPRAMDTHFAFTYGLHTFDKKEIEVLESKLDIGDLYSFFGNILAYLLTHDIELKDGHVITYQDDDSIPVSLSPGSYISGDTFKLEIE